MVVVDSITAPPQIGGWLEEEERHNGDTKTVKLLVMTVPVPVPVPDLHVPGGKQERQGREAESEPGGGEGLGREGRHHLRGDER